MRDTIYAEQSVIGGCLLDNDAFWKVAGIVRADDFTVQLHREMFREITIASNKGDQFDAITLSETTDLELADLFTLANNTPGTSNIVTYARIVRDSATVRQAAKICAEALGKLNEGDIDAITELAVNLEGLSRSEKPATTFFEALQLGFDQMEEAQKAQAEGGIIGAPTGIDPIDTRMRGLKGGKLIILAARPSLGKTALALQCAQSAAAAGFPTGILSLEMGSGEIGIRALAHQYQVNNTALGFGEESAVGQLTQRCEEDNDKLNRVRTLPIHIDEDTFDLNGILSRIAEWHRKHKIEFIVVDHLQLVELSGSKNRNDGLGEVTRSLKLLAKRLEIPIMLLCQLSRSVEKEKRAPKLSDLRDSGNIEQDADVVISLNGDLEPNKAGCRDVEIDFLKYRGGRVGWAGRSQFNGATQTFRKVTTMYDEQ